VWDTRCKLLFVRWADRRAIVCRADDKVPVLEGVQSSPIGNLGRICVARVRVVVVGYVHRL